jgi:hypothetical protein
MSAMKTTETELEKSMYIALAKRLLSKRNIEFKEPTVLIIPLKNNTNDIQTGIAVPVSQISSFTEDMLVAFAQNANTSNVQTAIIFPDGTTIAGGIHSLSVQAEKAVFGSDCSVEEYTRKFKRFGEKIDPSHQTRQHYIDTLVLKS